MSRKFVKSPRNFTVESRKRWNDEKYYDMYGFLPVFVEHAQEFVHKKIWFLAPKSSRKSSIDPFKCYSIITSFINTNIFISNLPIQVSYCDNFSPNIVIQSVYWICVYETIPNPCSCLNSLFNFSNNLKIRTCMSEALLTNGSKKVYEVRKTLAQMAMKIFPRWQIPLYLLYNQIKYSLF